MIEQNLGEGIATGKAEEAREAFEPFALGRQGLGLLVSDHLQPVFDRAQEDDRPLSCRCARPRSIQRSLIELVERGERVTVAQQRITAAGDQLLGLREELDLADAAAAELDIVALDRDLAMPAIGWICRFIACTSATAAKSKYLRQMNGASSPMSASPAAMSPAQAVP